MGGSESELGINLNNEVYGKFYVHLPAVRRDSPLSNKCRFQKYHNRLEATKFTENQRQVK